MKQHRPKFNSLWHYFARVNVPVQQLGPIIGGKVAQNIEIGKTHPDVGFENGCAIRMSYTLHHAGIIIGPGRKAWETSSGADKKLYIFRVAELRTFLIATFGKPDRVIKNPTARDLAGLKGILLFERHFRNASGHATLWDGRTCRDHCYFDGAAKAELWVLK
jgi:hypothetical protein